jgi:hypothetical protein
MIVDVQIQSPLPNYYSPLGKGRTQFTAGESYKSDGRRQSDIDVYGIIYPEWAKFMSGDLREIRIDDFRVTFLKLPIFCKSLVYKFQIFLVRNFLFFG